MSSNLFAFRFLPAIAFLAVVACDSGPQICDDGQAGCVCDGPAECDSGLTCTSGRCTSQGTEFTINVNEMGGTLRSEQRWLHCRCAAGRGEH